MFYAALAGRIPGSVAADDLSTRASRAVGAILGFADVNEAATGTWHTGRNLGCGN